MALPIVWSECFALGFRESTPQVSVIENPHGKIPLISGWFDAMPLWRLVRLGLDRLGLIYFGKSI